MFFKILNKPYGWMALSFNCNSNMSSQWSPGIMVVLYLVYFRACKTEKKLKEQYMKLLCLWFERIQRKEPGQQIVFLLDNTDASMRNSDMSFISFIIECLSTYFPCMLGKSEVDNIFRKFSLLAL